MLCNFSLGIKVPTIIEEAKSSLEAGFCVVIGLQTTGEVSDLDIYCNCFREIEIHFQLNLI